MGHFDCEDCCDGQYECTCGSDHECWEHEEVDTLEGRALCLICGAARSLSSEQIIRELELEAQIAEQWEAEMRDSSSPAAAFDRGETDV